MLLDEAFDLDDLVAKAREGKARQVGRNLRGPRVVTKAAQKASSGRPIAHREHPPSIDLSQPLPRRSGLRAPRVSLDDQLQLRRLLRRRQRQNPQPRRRLCPKAPLGLELEVAPVPEGAVRASCVGKASFVQPTGNFGGMRARRLAIQEVQIAFDSALVAGPLIGRWAASAHKQQRRCDGSLHPARRHTKGGRGSPAAHRQRIIRRGLRAPRRK